MGRLGLMLCAATLCLAAACAEKAPSEDDDGNGSGAGSTTTGGSCATACDHIYDCGLCVDVGEGCVLRDDCQQGCSDNGFQTVAVCVNGVAGCDADAIQACFSGGGPACNSCADFFDIETVTYDDLCGAAQGLFDNWGDCLCTGACAAACGDNVCQGSDPSQACIDCTGCNAELQACLDDT